MTVGQLCKTQNSTQLFYYPSPSPHLPRRQGGAKANSPVIVNIIFIIQDTIPGASGSPVVAFGGSYGGKKQNVYDKLQRAKISIATQNLHA